MYQLNETEIWREHRRELLREVSGPAWRPKKGVFAMRRRAALLLSAVGLAVFLVAGAAYALDIQCELSTSSPCIGTEAPDLMTGTGGLDSIVGLDGSDEIHGLAAPYRLAGDGNGTTTPGDHELFGGTGSNTLVGNAGSDLLSGGKDADNISADFLFDDGTDTVRGGPGSDTVNATERAKDIIDCGDGRRDRVEFDIGLDKIKNCEIKDPVSDGETDSPAPESPDQPLD